MAKYHLKIRLLWFALEKNTKKDHFGCNKTFFQKVNKTWLHYNFAKVSEVIVWVIEEITFRKTVTKAVCTCSVVWVFELKKNIKKTIFIKN